MANVKRSFPLCNSTFLPPSYELCFDLGFIILSTKWLCTFGFSLVVFPCSTLAFGCVGVRKKECSGQFDLLCPLKELEGSGHTSEKVLLILAYFLVFNCLPKGLIVIFFCRKAI